MLMLQQVEVQLFKVFILIVFVIFFSFLLYFVVYSLQTKKKVLGRFFGPFGTPATVFIGGIACNNTDVLNSTFTICALPPGAGRGLSVTINVQGQTSAISSVLFNYNTPTVTQLSSPVSSSGKFIYLIYFIFISFFNYFILIHLK